MHEAILVLVHAATCQKEAARISCYIAGRKDGSVTRIIGGLRTRVIRERTRVRMYVEELGVNPDLVCVIRILHVLTARNQPKKVPGQAASLLLFFLVPASSAGLTADKWPCARGQPECSSCSLDPPFALQS